ncbi:17208_t:CDS:2 [Dentiscutata heterogama]|uniref:17208_t:CDS:1 n=1 Tax=Dentiscutata heterogama TaxID=1316150 RepID=A0ACA9JX19_9GLOM|nr:17208_t:CDS:2 [Dentiscutata heterogama]
MTERSNTGSDLSVNDKKKPSSQELKNDITEELVQELEMILNITPVLISTEIVKNIQRLSKDNKQKEILKLKIETQFEFKEERRANKENLKETSNVGSLSNTRELTKNARSSSNQVIVEKLGGG